MPDDPRTLPSLHLARILNDTGEVRGEGEVDHLNLVREAAVEGGEPELVPIPVAGPVRWKASISNVGRDEFWLNGRVSGTAVMECSRCLEPTPVPVTASFEHLLRYDPKVETARLEYGDDDQEAIVFGDPSFDLMPVLAEAFSFAMPLSVLHDPACRGLCAVCGANLNAVPEGECAVGRADCPHVQHDRAEDPSNPFAKLRGLLED